MLCYCAGYAALIATGYSDEVAILGCDDDMENAVELIQSWSLSGSLAEWKSRSVTLMSSLENIRAIDFIAKALMHYETLDSGYLELLIERADGDIPEGEWHGVVSRQYPGMLT